MDSPALPDARPRYANWLFWLGWVAASEIGILLAACAMVGSIFIAKATVAGVNEDRLAGVLLFPILGASLGASQWVVLRTRISKAGWWILATVVGLLGGVVLGGGAVQALSYVTGRPWNWDFRPGLLTLYAIMGLSLGLTQLPVLWRHIKGAAVWILASMVGWLALGLIIGKSIDRTSDILALGPVPAAFTGLALLWLLRPPRTLPPGSA